MLKKMAMLAALFFAEFSAGALFNTAAVRPPFFICGVIIFFWHMTMEERMFLALGVGVLLDLLSPVPFGTFLFALLGVASVIEIWRYVFSDTGSLLSQALGATLSFLVFYGLALLCSLFLHGFSFNFSFFGGYRMFTVIAGAGIVWSVLFPPSYFFLKYAARRLYKSNI